MQISTVTAVDRPFDVRILEGDWPVEIGRAWRVETRSDGAKKVYFNSGEVHHYSKDVSVVISAEKLEPSDSYTEARARRERAEADLAELKLKRLIDNG